MNSNVAGSVLHVITCTLLQVFTAAQIQEMDHVQKHIKRRVPIAGNVSTTMLVNELVRVGLNDSLVRRALVYLVSAGEFEYRRGRKLIHRLQ